MSAQEEVAQMVERLRASRIRSELVDDLAALLERLQRELTEAREQRDDVAFDLLTAQRLHEHEGAERDALRSRLEAAEARNEKLEQDRIGNLQWIADCGCEDPPSLDSFGCGGKCAPCSAAAFLAQRPAAEEQGT